MLNLGWSLEAAISLSMFPCVLDVAGLLSRRAIRGAFVSTAGHAALDGVPSVSVTSPPRHPHSIWRRFWFPTGLLEHVPENASQNEAEEIRHRNNVWLKTYMDMYILRWGGLWAATMVVAVLAADEDVSGLVFVAAIAAASGALAGLAAMIWMYRRAARALGQSRR